MPSRARSRCPRCRQIRKADGTCSSQCARRRKAAGERARGSSTQQGYGQEHRELFRKPVLERDPVCVLCGRAPATQADHHPLSRRELIAQGLDPNDPAYGRGLCAPCHSAETARHQPGGWNRRSGQTRRSEP
ncbi:holin [Streptomyces albicerus]|uniref:holin n=1 Tax=Streptomyces albicerus TaxID=2569859 RepID=UPI001CEDC336|nr:holin [Streptomyces albicerus]